MAQDVIYIHDWWLSPGKLSLVFLCSGVEVAQRLRAELALRRPHMEKYRLDRLLERKAKEGVKVYVIL